MLMWAWGWKVGAAFYGGAAGGAIGDEGGGLDVGGQLVLAALSGDHDGEGQALAVSDAIDDGAGDLALVGPEVVEVYQGVTPVMPKTNWSMAAIMTKKKRVLMRPLISATCCWSSARRISSTASKVDSGWMAGGMGVRGLRLKMFMGFLSISLSRYYVHAELQGDVFDDGGDAFGCVLRGVPGDAVLSGVGADDKLAGLDYAGGIVFFAVFIGVAGAVFVLLIKELLEPETKNSDLVIEALYVLSQGTVSVCGFSEDGVVEGVTRGAGLVGTAAPGLL